MRGIFGYCINWSKPNLRGSTGGFELIFGTAESLSISFFLGRLKFHGDFHSIHWAYRLSIDRIGWTIPNGIQIRSSLFFCFSFRKIQSAYFAKVKVLYMYFIYEQRTFGLLALSKIHQTTTNPYRFISHSSLARLTFILFLNTVWSFHHSNVSKAFVFFFFRIHLTHTHKSPVNNFSENFAQIIQLIAKDQR